VVLITRSHLKKFLPLLSHPSLEGAEFVLLWCNALPLAQYKALCMTNEYEHRPLMSRHGKNKLSDMEEQVKKKSQNIYDYDGMISSQKQTATKTSMMQLASLSSDASNLQITDWSRYAACKGKMPLFFKHSCTSKCVTHPNGCQRVKSVRDCKALCGKCPVLDLCRQWALTENLEVGVAGGMTEYERLLFVEEHFTLGDIDE